MSSDKVDPSFSWAEEYQDRFSEDASAEYFLEVYQHDGPDDGEWDHWESFGSKYEEALREYDRVKKKFYSVRLVVSRDGKRTVQLES